LIYDVEEEPFVKKYIDASFKVDSDDS